MKHYFKILDENECVLSKTRPQNFTFPYPPPSCSSFQFQKSSETMNLLSKPTFTHKSSPPLDLLTSNGSQWSLFPIHPMKLIYIMFGPHKPVRTKN